MVAFVVQSVTPAPRIGIAVTAVDGGRPLVSTTYRGTVDVTVDNNQGPTRTQGPVQFFLPDSFAHTSDDLGEQCVAAAAVVPSGIEPIVADVRVLIDVAAGDFAADPRDAETSWVRLTIELQTTRLLQSMAVRLAYEVQTLVPAGAVRLP